MTSKSSRRPEGGDNLYRLPTSYVALDTETTGLDFDHCDLIEVGAVRVTDGAITDEYHSLIHINHPLDSFITSLTGITDEMLADAPGLDQVIGNFYDFTGDSVLMAHAAAFDMNFLYVAYERVLGRPLTNDYVDTLRVARRALPTLEHHRLSDICRALSVKNSHEHRALGDVKAMVECYGVMRDMVLKCYGSEDGYRRSFGSEGSSNKLKAGDITAEGEVDEGSPLFGTRCVFTGKMTTMSRREAMQRLANAGGVPEDRIKKDTDYLVIGNEGFCNAMKTTSRKIEKARQYQLKGLPIQIISESVFVEMSQS